MIDAQLAPQKYSAFGFYSKMAQLAFCKRFFGFFQKRVKISSKIV
jgi:hypothetical protein